MYLIVITTLRTSSGPRTPFAANQSVIEIATEQEFKDRVTQLIANGTNFQSYTAQRLAVATNVAITPIEPAVAYGAGGITKC